MCRTVADAGGDAYADTYMQVVGGGTRCIRWWYKVWAYRCGTGPVLQVVNVGGYRWYMCGGTGGTCVGIHRWERGKIASISYSSTTTPASKSQLVPATIPEYD